MFLFKTQANEKKNNVRGHDNDTDFYICDFGFEFADIFVIDAKIVKTLTGV